MSNLFTHFGPVPLSNGRNKIFFDEQCEFAMTHCVWDPLDPDGEHSFEGLILEGRQKWYYISGVFIESDEPGYRYTAELLSPSGVLQWVRSKNLQAELKPEYWAILKAYEDVSEDVSIDPAPIKPNVALRRALETLSYACEVALQHSERGWDPRYAERVEAEVNFLAATVNRFQMSSRVMALLENVMRLKYMQWQDFRKNLDTELRAAIKEIEDVTKLVDLISVPPVITSEEFSALLSGSKPSPLKCEAEQQSEKSMSASTLLPICQDLGLSGKYEEELKSDSQKSATSSIEENRNPEPDDSHANTSRDTTNEVVLDGDDDTNRHPVPNPRDLDNSDAMELFIAALQTKNHLKKQFQLLTEVAVQIFGQQSKPENDYIERVSGNQAYLDICKKLYVNPLNSNDVIAYIFYARTEIPPKLRASIMVAMGATGNFSNGNLKSFAQNNGLPLPQIRSGPKRIADKKWFEGWEKRVLNQRAVQR